MSDVCFHIGEAAGHVYRLLEKDESTISKVKRALKKSGYDSETVLMAIGWLAREDKLFMEKIGNICVIKLK
ncbi:winged helix-turn-helix domain-containing protein [Methanomethylovorans sp.]|uniref:winged helix-turn-helix domain-containing protein n=1 Tax=Methanomethylovorans sp. TaxID=2758717 RepID=UPI000AA35EDB|nr:winged helix-turn-helix domain-containing protein [Methanomethylovorans sp.]